jgi:hypothetical protein
VGTTNQTEGCGYAQSEIKAWLRGILVATCTKSYKYYRSIYIFEKPKYKKERNAKKH